MLKYIPLIFSFCCVTAQVIPAKPVLLKLTPEQIRDTFDNVMSDDYIRILAKDFASKAAEHFVTEMRNQKSALVSKFSQAYRTPVDTHTGYDTQPKLQQQIQELQKAQKLAQAQAQAQAKALVKAQQQVQAQQLAQAQRQRLVQVQQAQATAQAQVQANAQAQTNVQAQEKTKKKFHLQPVVENNEIQTQKKELLDSHEALNLLKDPEPDGDHLDSQSDELSGEGRDKIPVIQVMKINGSYYRRLLGLV